MVKDFLAYIQGQQLWDTSKDKILLAVSGGIDSIALVYLCQMAKIKFGIAHCNFQLRGADSEEDARFVQKLAQQLEVAYHETTFDTIAIMKQQQKSIQIVARELRYEWLEEIRKQHQYDVIGVGHHLNDSVETLLLNLTTGCGIKGLHGILAKNGHIVRPLLFTTKEKIRAFGKEMLIEHREDKSNQSLKYTRNLIRHQVVPALKEINPSLEWTMQHNLTRFRETEQLYNFSINQLKKEVLKEEKIGFSINVNKVVSSPAPQSLLYEILSPIGFSIKYIADILEQYEQEAGAIYYSTTHQVLKDRTYWYVRPRQEGNKANYLFISEQTKSVQLDQKRQVNFYHVVVEEGTSLDFNPKSSLYLDVEQVSFPLKIRERKNGDVFMPKGMEGKHKKVSKYLKDEKINRFDKANIRLLCDADDQILWVIGWRASELAKVTAQTANILKIELKYT